MSKIELFKTDVSNINAFSVQLKQSSPRITEVRFSTHGCPYYESIMFSGLVLQNREEVYTIHNVEEMRAHLSQIALQSSKITLNGQRSIYAQTSPINLFHWHVSRHLQANRWGDYSRVGEHIAWEDTKKFRDQKSKEAVFKFAAL